MLEVVKLIHSINAANQRDPPQTAVRGDDLRHHSLAWLDLAVQAPDGNLLVTLETESLPGRSLLEAQRKHPHADEVGAVNALKRLADDRANAEQVGALGGPITRGARAVFLAGEHDQRHPVFLVA